MEKDAEAVHGDRAQGHRHARDFRGHADVEEPGIRAVGDALNHAGPVHVPLHEVPAEAVEKRPNTDPTADARDYLVIGQEREFIASPLGLLVGVFMLMALFAFATRGSAAAPAPQAIEPTPEAPTPPPRQDRGGQLLAVLNKLTPAVKAALGNPERIFAADDGAWRYIFLTACIPGVLFTIAGLLVSESPRWLFRRIR